MGVVRHVMAMVEHDYNHNDNDDLCRVYVLCNCCTYACVCICIDACVFVCRKQMRKKMRGRKENEQGGRRVGEG